MARALTATFAPARLLVVRLSAIGDVIRTLPLLPPLRHRFPGARIDWLCEAASRPILERQTDVDRIRDFPRGELGDALRRGRLLGAAGTLRRRLRELRGARYELVIDAQGTYKSGLLALLSRAPVRVGYARGAAKEFVPGAATHPVAMPEAPISRVEKALRLLRPLNAPADRAAASLPEEPVAAERARALWSVAGDGPRVLLCPGASPRQSYKRWPAVSFGELARILSEAGRAVLVAWGPGEEELARQVAGAAGRRSLLLPTTSLLELAEIIRQAAVLVGNDSGPAHLAWLVGTRVVGLYGPTDPVVNAPWGSGHRLLDAVPPGSPRIRDDAVMANLAVDRVVTAVTDSLESDENA